MKIKNWQTYWKSHNLWFDAHVYGECLVNHTTKQFCVLIPKNASTWLRKQLPTYNFVLGNYHTDGLLEKAYTPIVVLRDPVDRWSSGLAEFLLRRAIVTIVSWKEHITQPLINLIFARVCLDEHTESQSMYLEGIDTEQTIFLEHNDNLNSDISYYLKAQGINNELDTSEKQFQTTSVKRQVKGYFADLIANNNQLKEKITNYYQVDTDLIQSVKYYKQQGNT